MTSIKKLSLFVAINAFLFTGLAYAEEAVQSMSGEAIEEIDAAVQAIETAEVHASSGLPQFDPTSWPSQIFWLTVFFIILYFVYAKFILPAIGGTIEKRAAMIAQNVTAAEALSKQAETLRAEVNAGLKSAGQTAADLMHTAETTAKTKMATAISQFRNRFETDVLQTENNIEAGKAGAMKDMHHIAASLAAQAAAKVAGINIDQSQAEDVIAKLTHNTKKAA